MKTTLNNYTIDDFIKLKPIIYEYCVNLTQKKTTTSWFRDFADADDLYQEVFLHVHDNYFNKPKEKMNEGKFTQIMKNSTYWTYHRRFTRKGAKLYQRLDRIDESPYSFFVFEESQKELCKGYVDFKETIDFKFYISKMNPLEIKAINMYLEGYPIKEIDEACKKHRGFFDYTVRVKLSKHIKADVVKQPKPVKIPVEKRLTLKEDDVEFLKTKVSCYDNVFNLKKANDKFIKLYSLYLQGVSIKDIAEIFKRSKHQISVELFRIKQKIKKYEQ